LPALDRLLKRKPAHRILWGLERTSAMLHSLGDPHRAFDSIHVGGTNGKGSTSAMIESVLRASGQITGLYTSPHLCEFAERIRVRGVPAGRALLEECAEDVLIVAEREDASFFESTTVLAFEVFRRSGCRVVVAEVGLGGRLDATNVLEPRVSVVSSVDRDHSNYLGDTLEEIAAEKAGILKPGVPVVVGQMDPAALDVLAARAADVDAPIEVLGREFSVDDVSTDLGGTGFRYRSDGWADGLQVRISLVGEHQARNSSLAIRSLERTASGVSPEDIVSGMGSAVWPGRFEVLSSRTGGWVLDIAHNPQAVATLAAMLEELPVPRPLVLLLSILGDKSWKEMLEPLLAVVSAAVFTIAPSSPAERRWNLEEARDAAGRWPVVLESDFRAAMTRARELAGVGTVVVTGSAHTVGDARRLITSDI